MPKQSGEQDCVHIGLRTLDDGTMEAFVDETGQPIVVRSIKWEADVHGTGIVTIEAHVVRDGNYVGLHRKFVAPGKAESDECPQP